MTGHLRTPLLPALLPLLGLLTRLSLGEETTSATGPPWTGDQRNWTLLDDGSLEISDFDGAALPPPDLQQGTQLRIANSIIQTIPDGTFPVDPNITDATLEIINTTIHEWGANNVDSFASITVTSSNIRRLNSRGIRHTRRSESACDDTLDPDIVVLINRTTIGQLHEHGVSLRRGRALLRLTESSVTALDREALLLGLAAQLRVEDTVFAALATGSFCRVCSHRVRFRRNRLLHVPAHALHFGSPRCRPPPGDYQCRQLYARRWVSVTGSRLECTTLGWLRDALQSCGSLTDQAVHDYRQFRDRSDCSDSSESVRSFLSGRPKPKPEPESGPAGGWCHSVGALAGVGAALAIGFLLVGLLAGCCYTGAGGRCSILQQNNRFVPASAVRKPDGPSEDNGDAGISLPLQRTDRDQCGRDSTDADRSPRASDGRYASSPVRAARPRASTPPPPPEEQRRRQGRGRRRPAREPPAARGQRPAEAGDSQIYVLPSARAAQQPAYDNQPVYANQPPVKRPEDPLYANQPTAQAPEGQLYVNQQWPQGPEEPSSAKHLYGNLHEL